MKISYEKNLYYIICCYRFSCKMITPSQFAKVKYGNIPYYANTLIVTEQDTLWAVFHHPKIW